MARTELDENGEPMLSEIPELEPDCIEPPLQMPEIELPTGLVGPEGRRESPYTSVDQLPDVVRLSSQES